MPTGIYIRTKEHNKKISEVRKKYWSNLENREKMRGAYRRNCKGENHPFWKGDMVGYSALHDWIIREYGAPKICFLFGLIKRLKENRLIN